MGGKVLRKPWGAGRIAFMARLGEVQSEIRQGIPLTGIYARHKAALGIGYPSFVKLVGRYASESRLTRRRPSQPGAQSPATTTHKEGPATHAGPAPGRDDHGTTFKHDGRTKEGEPEQLFGTEFLGPRRR
jgi:hypothetical protein